MTENKDGIKDFKIGVTEPKKFEIPDIKDGVYKATLKDIELKVDVPDGNGGTYDTLQWNFDVEGKTIQGKSSTIISVKSKAYAWISALIGKELTVGTDFSPSMIAGKPCTVVIKHNKRSKTFNGAQETQEIPYIADVLKA